jgi:hypothetical protein
MNAPPPGQERLLSVGATGMVGRDALRWVLDRLAVGRRRNSPRRPCCRPYLMNSVVSIARCQEVVQDEISHVIAQSLTGREVE